MSSAETDVRFRVLLLGDTCVGKSSLMLAFADDSFVFTEDIMPTIGVDFWVRTVDLDGTRTKLQLWDTAGQERFRTVISPYYQGADGIMLVYDVTDRQSFDNVTTIWMEEVKKYGRESVNILLVGHKCDVTPTKRQVTAVEGQQLADSLGVPFTETSAKNSANIDSAYLTLASDIKTQKSGGGRGKLKGITPTTLKEQLPLNPYFVPDELELIPSFLPLEAVGGDFKRNPLQASSVQVLSCGSSTTQCLRDYCKNMPPAFQSVTCVRIHGEGGSTSTVLAHLEPLFSCATAGHDKAAGGAHTIVLEGSSTDLACAIVGAKFPSLSRLVLEGCTKVDFMALLRGVEDNKFIEEVCLGKSAVSGDAFEYMRTHCGHVNFGQDPEEFQKLAPPKAVLSPNEACSSHKELLQGAVSKEEFLAMCREGKELVGLETPHGGIVPISRACMPRFQLLVELFKSPEEEGEENIVPLGMEPSVSVDTVALAVHFVTHCVSEEVHTQAVEGEAQRGSDTEAKATAATSDVTYTWCHDFTRFQTTHIQRSSSTGNTTVPSAQCVQVLCELLALAAYLNCPSLKRFVRAALVMEGATVVATRINQRWNAQLPNDEGCGKGDGAPGAGGQQDDLLRKEIAGVRTVIKKNLETMNSHANQLKAHSADYKNRTTKLNRMRFLKMYGPPAAIVLFVLIYLCWRWAL